MSLDCTAGLYFGINLKNISEEKENKLYELINSRDIMSTNKFDKIGIKSIGYLEEGNINTILYFKEFSKEINTSDYYLNINVFDLEQTYFNEFIEQLNSLLREINENFIEPNIFLALEY